MKLVRTLSVAAVVAVLSTSAFAGGFGNSTAGAIGFGIGFGTIVSTGSQQVTTTFNNTGKFGSLAGSQASNTSFSSAGSDTGAFAASGGAAFSSSSSSHK
jgi:hypothetical protein